MKRLDENDRFGTALLGASVGTVDREQAGILPTQARVTDEMVQRALREGENWGNPLGGAAIRAMLEAAFRGRG